MKIGLEMYLVNLNMYAQIALLDQAICSQDIIVHFMKDIQTHCLLG